MRPRSAAARALLAALLAVAALALPASASHRYADGGPGYWNAGTPPRIDAHCLSLPEPDQTICRVQALKNKPFVVVAFIDTGINPYHNDFRAPEMTVHPSEYIEDYPAGIPSLDLTFGSSYSSSVSADSATWSAASRMRHYWIPGTRVIGAISMGSGLSSTGTDIPILDENGHGTAVASVSAGRVLGVNPNALIVVVEGLGDLSLKWVRAQPWIDVVSNSWGTIANVPLGDHKVARDMEDAGKSVLFAGGNGFWPNGTGVPWPISPPDTDTTLTSPYTGPSWGVKVGAASPVNGQSHYWRSIPPDVSSFGSSWPAAHPYSTTGTRSFGGTSNATPVTAGVFSLMIQTARERFADTGEGPRRAGDPAEGAAAVLQSGGSVPAAGPLADGTLSRLEVEQTVLKTAYPVDYDPATHQRDVTVWPTTPAFFAYQGYGIVDAGSRDRALRVLDGIDPLPDRTVEDAWMTALDAIRDALWAHRR